MTDSALRERLAHQVQALGTQDPRWLAAFRSVPRHVLVPAGRLDRNGVHVNSADVPVEQWRDIVYQDQPIFIREEEDGLSSSSMPSIMAQMLDLLRVDDDSTVLEIGTGSGYNAALLCHRLGAGRVTSIDIEPELVEAARQRLRSIGYEPQFVVADGAEGYPMRAPYDRVIGTCRVWPIPVSWIRQCSPGGRVVAVIPDGCVGLDVSENGSATGRFHPQQFSFMPMRGWMPELKGDVRDGASRAWRYPVDILQAGGQEQASFRVLVRALVWTHGHCWPSWDWDKVEGLISYDDRSWVMFDKESGQVSQGGSRRLWDEIEQLYDEWCRLGAPNRERFGLTIESGGRHVMWLDDPTAGPRWEVWSNLATAS